MKLSNKIIILVTSLSILFSISTSIFLNRSLTHNLHDIQQQWSYTLVRAITEAITLDTINGNALHAREQLKSVLQSDASLVYAFITDFDNHLFAHTFDGGFPRQLAHKKHTTQGKFDSTTKFMTKDAIILDVMHPLIEGMQAHLHIGINQDIANNLTDNVIQNITIIVFILAVIGSAVALFLGDRISTPLQNLAARMRAYGKDDEFSELELTSADAEIRDLTTTFNTMLKDRARINDTLLERERYLTCTLDSIGDAVIATDAQGRITRMNPIAERLTGFNYEQAKGQLLPKVFHIVNSLTRELVDNPVEKVLSSGKIIGLANHTILISVDGTEHHIADSGAPIKDDNSNIMGVILVFRDISEEYQQQVLLHKNRTLLAEAQRIAHIGSWEHNLATNHLDWTDETFRIFEIAPNKFGVSYEEFLATIHPDDREPLKESYTESLKSKTPYSIEYRLLFKDGRIKYARENGTTYFDDEGQAIRTVGTVQDISQQKEVEQKLIKASSEWNYAMDYFEDILYLVDLDNKIIRANRAFYKLVNLRPSQVIGKDICSIFHKHDTTTLCPVDKARRARRDAIITLEANHPDNPTGSPVETTIRVVRDNNGEALSILMGIHDLTRQREIENELRRHRYDLETIIEQRTADLVNLNKELESFSYSVSHDLRAPLRSIDGFSRILLEDYFDSLDDDGKDYLHRVRSATLLMSDLIDDLLQLSRVSRGDLSRKTVNMSILAKTSIKKLSEAYPDRNVEVSISSNISTDGDEKLLGIMLDNILGNAWKYTSKTPHAKIEFGCETQNGKTVYYVKDNGVGFDIQYVHRLFNAFNRLHGSEFEGTGIGLATVQRIIQRHNGKIWAEAAIDKGATFYFTL